MDLPGEPPTWPDCEALGYYFKSLLSDQKWVRRRVETVDVISAVRFERRVSLDIDVGGLRKRASDCGVTDTKRLYFPIALFNKRLLIDFDVVDGRGHSLSLATSDEDSHAAMAALLATADQLGFDPSAFSTGVLDKLYEIVRYPPTAEDVEAIASASDDQDSKVKGWELTAKYAINAGDVDWWKETLFADHTFVKRAAEFTTQCMPIVGIDTERSPQIIKYRTVESEPVADTKNWTWAERLGWNEVYFGIDTPNIGRAQREHVRITSPGGVFGVSIDVVDTGSDNLNSGPKTPQPSGDTSIGRLTAERALVYTANRSTSAPHAVIVGFRPAVGDFRTPAVLGTFVSAMLLLGGAIGQWTWDVLSKVQHSTEAAVAVLIVIPSLLAAFLVRDGEHEVRSKLLMFPRWFVGGTTALTIVAGISVIIGFSGHTLSFIWLSCGLVCLLAYSYLELMCRRIERHHQDIIATSDEQFTIDVEKI